jgi:hypothetical protein
MKKIAPISFKDFDCAGDWVIDIQNIVNWKLKA